MQGGFLDRLAHDSQELIRVPSKTAQNQHICKRVNSLVTKRNSTITNTVLKHHRTNLKRSIASFPTTSGRLQLPSLAHYSAIKLVPCSDARLKLQGCLLVPSLAGMDEHAKGQCRTSCLRSSLRNRRIGALVIMPAHP